jgi:hypothetical protein
MSTLTATCRPMSLARDAWPTRPPVALRVSCGLIYSSPNVHTLSQLGRDDSAVRRFVSRPTPWLWWVYICEQEVSTLLRRGPGDAALTYDRGLFFWVAAHELLPSGWQWQRALAVHGAQQGSAELSALGRAVMYRTTRVLQARDHLQRLANQPQDNNVAEDSLAALDTCLIYLVGALDAVARGADSLLGLGSGYIGVGWQHDRWLAKVRSVNHGLADVTKKGAGARDLLTILLRLRNSIHGAGLSALAVRRGSRAEQTAVQLPAADAATIVASIARLGGVQPWGVTQAGAGRLLIDPASFVEQLLPRVLVLLNELMARSPVASLAPLFVETSTVEDDTFSEPFRLSIRWQLGL